MPNTSRDKERQSRREKIERMIAVEGKQVHEVARSLGCTYDQVYYVVVRHGIKPLKARQHEDRDHLAADPNYLIPAIRKALGCRIDERKDGYRLDGRPVGFGDVVRAANLVHKRRGMEQIGNNPAWWAR